MEAGEYRPHIVIGPQSQRHVVRSGNTITEEYLGVMLIEGPESMPPGGIAVVGLALMYFPENPYRDVVPGATFTIREGPLIVGYGTVLSRSDVEPSH